MKILIGTDFSDESVVALRQGFAMAQAYKNEGESVEIFVGYVEGQGTWYPQVGATILDDPDNRWRMEGQVDDFLQERLGEAHLGAPGEEIEYTVALAEGRSDKGLVKIADELGVDWLCIGKSGEGALARMVVGSTVDRLAHRPPCRLAIAHPHGPDWTSAPDILVGVDFSKHSEKALEMALDVAEVTGATLHIVNVVYPPGPIALPDGLVGYTAAEEFTDADITAIQERAAADIHALIDERKGRLKHLDWTTEVLTGYPTREIVGYAEDNDVDVIVLGTVGRTALDDFLLGSVASGVVKHMPCTVFLSPPADKK